MPPRKRIEKPSIPNRYVGQQQQIYANVYLAAYVAYHDALRGAALTDLADRVAAVAVRRLCANQSITIKRQNKPERKLSIWKSPTLPAYSSAASLAIVVSNTNTPSAVIRTISKGS
jgi:hypothetical protein